MYPARRIFSSISPAYSAHSVTQEVLPHHLALHVSRCILGSSAQLHMIRWDKTSAHQGQRPPPPFLPWHCQSTGNGNTWSCEKPANIGGTNWHSWLNSHPPRHGVICNWWPQEWVWGTNSSASPHSKPQTVGCNNIFIFFFCHFLQLLGLYSLLFRFFVWHLSLEIVCSVG